MNISKIKRITTGLTSFLKEQMQVNISEGGIKMWLFGGYVG